MPPVAIRLHGSFVGRRARIMFAREIERPRALPIFQGHVDRAQRVPHLIQPNIVCVSQSHPL